MYFYPKKLQGFSQESSKKFLYLYIFWMIIFSDEPVDETASELVMIPPCVSKYT